MTDVFTKEKRSHVMARIRSSGNISTELAMVMLFRKAKITGWRRKSKIQGRPDFVFPQEQVAIFIDGCFWHNCPRHCKLPKHNRKFWKSKLLKNSMRDRVVTRGLRKQGWKVLRIWEHQLRKPESVITDVQMVLLSRIM